MTTMANTHPEKASAVLNRIESLPSLSDVVQEFIEISRREYIGPRDLERVVSKDQALVARLLKVANSGLYGASRSVATVSDAVVLIGLDNMKKIVYAVASEGLMCRELRRYIYPEKGFWVHSMAVGMTCRAIADTARDVELLGEEAFVAGLLHDTAQLILDDFLDVAPGKRLVEPAEEASACGLDHTMIGEEIVRRWKISDRIAEAVRYHHDPGLGGTWRRGASCVALAESICSTWRVGLQPGMDLGEDIPAADHGETLDAIGLPAEALPGMLWELRRKLESLEKLYEDT
jgi:HD-like signal output (HDOD) protein